MTKKPVCLKQQRNPFPPPDFSGHCQVGPIRSEPMGGSKVPVRNHSSNQGRRPGAPFFLEGPSPTTQTARPDQHGSDQWRHALPPFPPAADTRSMQCCCFRKSRHCLYVFTHVPGADLPGAWPREAAVLLSLLPAPAVLAVQAAARPRGPQSAARGPCVPGTQGTNAPRLGLRGLKGTC